LTHTSSALYAVGVQDGTPTREANMPATVIFQLLFLILAAALGIRHLINR
jgi:hypothetical protein